jgi:hypothetical protein
VRDIDMRRRGRGTGTFGSETTENLGIGNISTKYPDDEDEVVDDLLFKDFNAFKKERGDPLDRKLNALRMKRSENKAKVV